MTLILFWRIIHKSFMIESRREQLFKKKIFSPPKGFLAS
jgi:hypothetical protein